MEDSQHLQLAAMGCLVFCTEKIRKGGKELVIARLCWKQHGVESDIFNIYVVRSETLKLAVNYLC